MPLTDLVCCLAASITSQYVGELKETSNDSTYRFWLARGSIINSTIQNKTFIPLVSPLLLHRLFIMHKSQSPVTGNEKEEHRLCALLHHMEKCAVTGISGMYN